MDKKRFLNELRQELSYELPDMLVRNNVEYYSAYIDTEVRKGRSQDEVLSDLGDPRLIARTVIDAAKSGADGIPYTSDDRDFSGQIYGGGGGPAGYGADSYGSEGYTEGYADDTGRDRYYEGSRDEDRAFGRDSGQRHRSNMSVRYYNFGCLGFLILMLVLFSVFSLIGTAVSYLMPILGPVIIVCILIWLFNNMRGDE